MKLTTITIVSPLGVALLGVALLGVATPTVASAQTAVPPPPASQTAPPPAPDAYAQPAPAQQPQQQPQQVPQQVYVVQTTPQYGQQPYAQPPPQGTPHEVEHPRIGLVVSGAVLLGISWLIHAALVSSLAGYSLDSGLQSEWDGFRGWGLVPLAGPWVQMAVKPTEPSADGWSTYLTIDGLLQATGLTLLILGFAIPTTRIEYSDNDGGPSFAVTPVVGPGSAGLSLSSRF